MRAAIVASTLLLAPAVALGNGRYPTGNQLVARPNDASQLLLRTTFGLLVTSDAGAHWDWICEQSVGYEGVVDPGVAYGGGGALLASLPTGLARSTDRGCQWTLASAPLPTGPNAFMADLTVRSDRPSSVLALQSSFAMTSGSYDNVLYSSDDDGASFVKKFTFDPTLLVYSVEYAPPKRVYVSGARNAGTPQLAAALLVSDDDGASFVERPVPIDPKKETAVYVAGVDPSSADRVYLRTRSAADMPYNRLLVSEDAGKTWKVIFTGGALLGFALSSDGSKVWIGGEVDGVNVAARADFAFTKKSAVDAQCLAFIGGKLWACAKTAGFALGASSDDGASFTPVLQLNQVRGQLACPSGTSTDAQCTARWPVVRDLLKIDAGVASADAGPTTKPSGGCSCDAAPSTSTPLRAWAAWTGVFLFWALMRRRRA